jgi:hypothetical protein
VEGEPARSEHTLDGGLKTIRIDARLVLGNGPQAPAVNVLLWLPKSEKPVPVFLYLNFKGNAAEHAAPAMLARGYGVATACYEDIFPDKPEGRSKSALAALGRTLEGELPPDEPGAIATWAWGLSRILDWLVRLPEVDATRVIVVGHSRNGKAALWAGELVEMYRRHAARRGWRFDPLESTPGDQGGVAGGVEEDGRRSPVRGRLDAHEHEAGVVDRGVGEHPLDVPLHDAEHGTDQERQDRQRVHDRLPVGAEVAEREHEHAQEGGEARGLHAGGHGGHRRPAGIRQRGFVQRAEHPADHGFH